MLKMQFCDKQLFLYYYRICLILFGNHYLEESWNILCHLVVCNCCCMLYRADWKLHVSVSSDQRSVSLRSSSRDTGITWTQHEDGMWICNCTSSFPSRLIMFSNR